MTDNGSLVDYKGFKLPAHLARDLELFEFMLEDSQITRSQIESAMSAKTESGHATSTFERPEPRGDYSAP